MTPYDLAYEYAMHTSRSIYLTGKAGTGKTTFLRKLQLHCPKQIVVCAPTGVAAINAEGVTIHSLLQLPPQVFLPTESARRILFSEMRLNARKLRTLRSIEMMVIDEVSMVRADLLDTIDAVLRHVRRKPHLPFGGVQMLFIGDLYQLSPVAKEAEWQLMRPYYEGPYFFQAQIFRTIQPVYIELDKVFRQTNQQFISILNEVRTNSLTPESLALLNERCQPGYRDKRAILLSTHNHKVDLINQSELDALRGKAYQFEAVVKNTFPESMYPMDTTLTLKVGARVMFIKNDSSLEKAYYNGKLGTVLSIKGEEILVLCEGEKDPVKVHTETWENLRYVPDKEQSDLLRTEVAGTFTHFPLRLAWAVTIHKAQGLTFDRVIIDAADAFAAGQVYVALSRCRSLEGITLLSPIPSGALTNARDVLRFSESQPSLEAAEAMLTASELHYLLTLLCGLYDFSYPLYQVDKLRKLVSDAASFNQPATDTFLTSLRDAVSEWQRVGEQFQNQLRVIFFQPELDYTYLSKRLNDAFGYFVLRLDNLLREIPLSPAMTDDKEDAKDYQELIQELFVDLSRQKHIMAGIGRKPSIQTYFALRASFVIPSLKLSASGEDKMLTEQDSEHPLLLKRLRIIRAALSKEAGKPAYLFAPTAALVEISNSLPLNKSQLMRVKGFGAKMFGLWGERIIDEVRTYVLRDSSKA